MNVALIIALVVVSVLLIAALVYIWRNYYEGRYDRTYMTHDDRGFKRGIKGKTVLWDPEETVVRGPEGPRIEFVAVDPATGGRRMVQLLDSRTGSLNLRPQYCAPLPFEALTADGHKILVDARVQFSINRDLLKHVYEIQDFAMAIETRIHSAYRAQIGKRKDEVLRAEIHDVERNVIEHLRTAEAEGDEKGEPGMALGVNFHTASFTFTQPDEFAIPGLTTVPGAAAATPETVAAIERARAVARSQGVLALRPQQLDQLADTFVGRDPASTAALLALLDMQTRQNIAEALAQSGQLLVLTPQELGLVGAAAQRDAMAKRALAASEAALPAQTNGGIRPDNRA
ncbi:hypothetical protein [Terricaulis sp.]|uniref:hypothetical protein n=1 Tax=Terricaulis sp. TaxID=2768686 RepID=UPI003782FADF